MKEMLPSYILGYLTTFLVSINGWDFLKSLILAFIGGFVAFFAKKAAEWVLEKTKTIFKHAKK
jgi:hypothetical protein